MEFSEGNFGMIQGALDYSKDVTPPETTIEYSAAQTGIEPINDRFNRVNEPSVIYYRPTARRRRQRRGRTTTRVRAARARC